MIIRKEEQNDFDDIYNLIKTAFKTAKKSDGDEQDFALALKNSDRYIPELSLVAVLDKKLIGHIMLTKNYIETDSGNVESLLLAPLSVLTEYRNKGIGASLVNNALAIAKDLEYKAAFLCGDPAYYERFGFISVSNFNIKPLMKIPKKYVLVCELQPKWLNGIKGTINIM